MVSFRHHLVSIIAIFLALAVGVALGAGPLRDGATDLMAGQNAEITAERDQLLADRDAATPEIAGRDSVIDAMASSLSDGVLVGVGQVAEIRGRGLEALEPFSRARGTEDR